MSLSPLVSIFLALYILWSLTNIGLLYENSSWAWPSEMVRCTISLLLIKHVAVVFALPEHFLQIVFTGSSLLSSVIMARWIVSPKGGKQE